MEALHRQPGTSRRCATVFVSCVCCRGRPVRIAGEEAIKQRLTYLRYLEAAAGNELEERSATPSHADQGCSSAAHEDAR